MDPEPHDLCPKTGRNHVVRVEERTSVRCVDCGFLYPEGPFRTEVLRLDAQRRDERLVVQEAFEAARERLDDLDHS